MTDKKPNEEKKEENKNELTQEQIDQMMADVIVNFPFDDYAQIITNIMEVFDDPNARAGFRKYLQKEKNKK